MNNYTPEQFVKATIAFMKQKNIRSVSFDRKCFDINLTKSEMPWCITYDEFIDTVSIPDEPEHQGTLCICVCTDGGQILYNYFDGSENEDFDELFHWVYDEIWDGGMEDDEADIYFDKFIKQ